MWGWLRASTPEGKYQACTHQLLMVFVVCCFDGLLLLVMSLSTAAGIFRSAVYRYASHCFDRRMDWELARGSAVPAQI